MKANPILSPLREPDLWIEVEDFVFEDKRVTSADVPETENIRPKGTYQQARLFENTDYSDESGAKIMLEDNRPKFRIIGQVFETYWLIQYEDKLLVIDQHAAHEKVNYERLMKRVNSQVPSESPFRIRLSASDAGIGHNTNRPGRRRVSHPRGCFPFYGL